MYIFKISRNWIALIYMGKHDLGISKRGECGFLFNTWVDEGLFTFMCQ